MLTILSKTFIIGFNIITCISVIITIKNIIDQVSRAFGVSDEDIQSNKKKAEIVNARQFAMYIVREVTNLTLDEIGRNFGNKKHSTVLYSCEAVEEKIEEIPTIVPAVAGCVDCRILQVRLEEKQATIDSLRDQLDKAQDANRQLMDLLKSTVSHADTNEHQKKKIG